MAFRNASVGRNVELPHAPFSGRHGLVAAMKNLKSLPASCGLALLLGLGATLAQAQSSSSTKTNPNNRALSETEVANPDNNGTSGTKLKFSDKHFITKVAESTQLELAVANLAAERASNPEVRSFAQQLVTDHAAMCRQLDQLAQKKGIESEVAEYRYRGNAAAPTGVASSGNQARPPGSSANPDSMTARSGSDASIGAGAPTGRTAASDDMSGSMSATADWNDPTHNRHYKKLAGKSGEDFDKEFLSMMVSDHEDDVSKFEKKAEKPDDSDVHDFASTNLPTLTDHLKRAQQLAANHK